MESQSFFKVYNASAGSGKTFTLVKEYLKILFSEGDFEFQKILAITFTNKAASEMKDRVLTNLKDASKGIKTAIVEDLKSELGLEDKDIQIKSKKILNNILRNYASFNIVTIDSFTHKLIRTFSMDLGLPLDFEVELDVEPLLKETIDILISKIGENKELTNYLVKYTIDKVNDDKSWDLNAGLVQVAKLLLSEENEIEVSKLVNTSLEDFKFLEKKLRVYLNEVEKSLKNYGKQAIELIDEKEINHKSFSSSAVPNYFKKLINGWNNKEELLAIKTVQKCFDTGNFYPKTKPKTEEQAIDRASIEEIKEELYPLFTESYGFYTACFGDYFLIKKVLKTLVPLAVLNHINKEFVHLKKENNIRLNAEFNRLISKEIKDQPVPFIYERLGEKFNYFFIDEMQDTSELQWENLIPLVQNALSQSMGGVMLVGDAKQSIYRWRGGKASQFVSLSSSKDEYDLFVEKNVHRLGTNYRSYSEVISFNNSFFKYLSNHLKEEEYQEIYSAEEHQKTNSKEGGFVSVEIHPQEEDFDKHEFYPQKAKLLIEEIESKGFHKSDICILVRNKAQGNAITNYLMAEGMNVISPDNLLLKNNKIVQFLVFLLKYFENTEDKELLFEVLKFLYNHLQINIEKHAFYATCLSKETPDELFESLGLSFKISSFFSESLYDGVEQIIRGFHLQDQVDVFVQAFLDVVLQYQIKDSGTLQGFLEHWDKKKGNLKVEVALSKDAVQLMTVHKSKGLEFPVVIFMYDLNTEDITKEDIWYNTEDKDVFSGFNSFQIKASSNLSNYGEQGGKLLEKIQQDIQLDNFNLLYVALTRAEEQLYVVTDTDGKIKDKPQNYSHYFINYLKENLNFKGVKYEVGSPERKSEVGKSEDAFVLEDFLSVDKEENQINVSLSKLEDTEAIEFGNLVHEALEKIVTINDFERGENYINNSNLKEEFKIRALSNVKNIINSPILKKFFDPNNEIYNERSIVDQLGDLYIIDKLMICNNKAYLLDFKTGIPLKKHKYQVKKYEGLLIELGFQVEGKYLVYCDDSLDFIEEV